MTKKGLFWVFCFYCGFAQAAEPLTLTQAIRYALEHSPTLNSVKRELSISDFEKKNAQARFFPSLDLSSSHGLSDGRPRSSLGSQTAPWTSSVSLGLTETLYDNGESFTQYQIEKLKNQRAQLLLKKEKNKLCLSVTEEYLRFSLFKKQIEIEQDQYQLFKKQYDQTAQAYQQGLKTRKDYLRLKTQVSRSLLSLTELKNFLEKSELSLKKTLGVSQDQEQKISFVSDAFVPESSLFSVKNIPLVTPKLENHYETDLAKINRKIYEQETRLVSRRYWPEITLTSGVTYQSSDYLGRGASSFQNNDSLSWNVLLGVTYNLWDWGTKRRDVYIAQERQQIQNNELEKTLLTTRQELTELMLDLVRLQKDYRLNEELLVLEQKNFELLESDYRLGKAQYLDLVTALRDLGEARGRVYSSLSELKQKVFSYRYHEGKLYELFQ